MLIDGKLIEVGSLLRAEFCVIGTGIGGATLAQKLSGAGRDVLLVEAGGAEGEQCKSPLAPVETLGRRFGLPLSRAIE